MSAASTVQQTEATTARTTRDLYNNIAVDYSAIKTNEYKRWIEEPTFLDAVNGAAKNYEEAGGVARSVVDLGCGSGHFCRILVQKSSPKWDAVHGIDVSDAMIREAIRLENETPLGIRYRRADILSASEEGEEIFSSEWNAQKADLCTAEYLFPYASTVEDLRKFATFAAGTLRPGGQFVSITTVHTDAFHKAGVDSFWAVDTWGFSFDWDTTTKTKDDGMLANVTLLGSGHKTRVTFPNYLWSKETITQVLLESGFDRVEWLSPKIGAGAPKEVLAAFEQNGDHPTSASSVPVGYFVATLQVAKPQVPPASD